MTNPQAVFAAGSTPVAGAVLYAVERVAGVDFSGVDGVFIGGGITAALFWFGRNGLRGLALAIWRGFPGTGPESVPPGFKPPE